MMAEYDTFREGAGHLEENRIESWEMAKEELSS